MELLFRLAVFVTLVVIGLVLMVVEAFGERFAPAPAPAQVAKGEAT